MANIEAKTAKDMDGKTLRVGDKVIYVPYSEEPNTPIRVVEIKRIRRQGYDGTILTTEPSPEACYPHHMSCVAKRSRKVG